MHKLLRFEERYLQDFKGCPISAHSHDSLKLLQWRISDNICGMSGMLRHMQHHFKARSIEYWLHKAVVCLPCPALPS